MIASWFALSRKKRETVSRRQRVGPCEEQPLGDALAREKSAIGQEHADIRGAAARDPAGVLQPNSVGKAMDNNQEMRVHDGRTAVGDRVNVILPPAKPQRALQRSVHLPRHVKEFKPHIAPGQGIVVRHRKSAGHPSVDCAQSREVRAVDRVIQVTYVWIERIGRRVRIEVDECRVVQGVFEKVGEVVYLSLAQPQAARRA